MKGKYSIRTKKLAALVATAILVFSVFTVGANAFVSAEDEEDEMSALSGNKEIKSNTNTVTFDDENNIEDVEIEVYEDEDLEQKVSDTLTTDQDGEATKDLEDGEYWFNATKEGRYEYLDNFTVDGSDKTVEFTMVEVENSIEMSIDIEELKIGDAEGHYFNFTVKTEYDGSLADVSDHLYSTPWIEIDYEEDDLAVGSDEEIFYVDVLWEGKTIIADGQMSLDNFDGVFLQHLTGGEIDDDLLLQKRGKGGDGSVVNITVEAELKRSILAEDVNETGIDVTMHSVVLDESGDPAEEEVGEDDITNYVDDVSYNLTVVKLPMIIVPEELELRAGEWKEFTGEVKNPENGLNFDAVYFDFTVENITVDDIELRYYDGIEEEWKPAHLEQDNENVTGRFGPGDGFPMGPDYNETTEFNVSINKTGDYTATVDLYDVEEEELVGVEESVELTVKPADVDYVIIYPENDKTITSGENLEFSAEAYDEYDNLITENNEHFTWENATYGLFDETEVGDYNVSAEYESVTSDNITVTVEPLELTIDSTEGGNVTEPGNDPDTFEYEYGDTVNLEALADDNYHFVKWTGDNNTIEDTTANQTTIEMLGDYTITAEFEINTYTLDISSTEGGNVTEPGDDPATFEYDHGTVVVLEALAEEGYRFVEWTGDNETIDDTEDNQTTIEMLDDYTITALFEKVYNLTIEIEGEGRTEPEKGDHIYYEGEDVTIEAIPEDGWYFEEWTGDYQGTEKKINITMDEDKTITARFKEIPTYTLTIEMEGEGHVVVDPDQEEYEENTEVNLEAIPDEDWYFEEWTGDYESEEEEITITMDENKSITAVFSAYEPFFEVEITDYDEQVKAEEYVTIRYTVENTGDIEGTQDIVLHVEGLEEDREEDVTLDVGEEYTGEFFWSAEEGSHLIRVSSDDDAYTVPITVVEDPSVTPGFTSLLLILGTVVAVAVYHKKKQ